MATDRARRRKRHKAHKVRSRNVEWKFWPLWLRGEEFAIMADFDASNCDPRIAVAESGPLAGQVVQMPDRREFWQVHEASAPLPTRYSADWRMPDVRTTTYRVVRQREGRLFFGGTVRRYRNLPSKLVLEDVYDGN